MEKEILCVRMFGKFSMYFGGRAIAFRKKGVWDAEQVYKKERLEIRRRIFEREMNQEKAAVAYDNSS